MRSPLHAFGPLLISTLWVGLTGLTPCLAEAPPPSDCQPSWSATPGQTDLEQLAELSLSQDPTLWKKLFGEAANLSAKALKKVFPGNAGPEQAQLLREALTLSRPEEIAEIPELLKLLKSDADSLSAADGKVLTQWAEAWLKRTSSTSGSQKRRKKSTLEELRLIQEKVLSQMTSSGPEKRSEATDFLRKLEQMIDLRMVEAKDARETIMRLEPKVLRSQEHRDTLLFIFQASSDPLAPPLSPKQIAMELNSRKGSPAALGDLREQYSRQSMELMNQPAVSAEKVGTFKGKVVGSTASDENDKASAAVRERVTQLAALGERGAKKWQSVLPDSVYKGAATKKETPVLQPLSRLTQASSPQAGVENGGVRFLHGTSPEGRDGIFGGTIHLTSGWGDIGAGFFLDMNGGNIAQGYAKKGGVMLEVSLDPEAPTIEYGSQLWREIENWVLDPSNQEVIKKKHPEFYRIAKSKEAPTEGVSNISRDDLARAFGAKVLINRTVYGQVQYSEAVVLDPSVVLKVRQIH